MKVSRLPPLQDVHLLLVEDEPDVADLLVFVLETAGATVSRCSDARTALSLLESHSPDLLLSNVQLSPDDGIWLIQQIRNHPCPALQRLPAIAVTSYEREVCVSRVLAAGFNCFLSKLDSPNALVETISAIVSLS